MPCLADDISVASAKSFLPWWLIAELPGLASHGSGLHLRAGCEQSGSSWVFSGTQPEHQSQLGC